MAKVAIVTGGTRGIGRAICLALKETGIIVGASYVSDVKCAEAFSNDTGIAVFRWDVSDPQACLDGARKVEDALGPTDILVNNAGITRDVAAHKMQIEDWRAVIDTNLGGCFNMIRAVYPGMRERRWGRIINIGSINGQGGQFGQINYSAAKAGIHGLTKALALEGAKFGVTTNTIAPGYCNTEMVAAVPADALAKVVAKVPLGRLGEADEIGAAVAFLCSDKAGYFNGSQLSINGGHHMY